MSKVRFLGLDVHEDTIAASIVEPDGEVRPLGIIPNRLESIRKLAAKLGPANQLKACYEADPTGYVLYWQLTALTLALLNPLRGRLAMKCRCYNPDDLPPCPPNAGRKSKNFTMRRSSTRRANVASHLVTPYLSRT